MNDPSIAAEFTRLSFMSGLALFLGIINFCILLATGFHALANHLDRKERDQ